MDHDVTTQKKRDTHTAAAAATVETREKEK